ncbi:MAG TPA: SGNH/GDSL hydrolase family protein, partial [Candidatus Brocadiia bacterium]|nr:SGNH/GDSL hydrolase family protein [Candidatus Brocadiia bacterium]
AKLVNVHVGGTIGTSGAGAGQWAIASKDMGLWREDRLSSKVLGDYVIDAGPVATLPVVYKYAAMGDSVTDGSDYDGTWLRHAYNLRGMDFGGTGLLYNVAVGGARTETLLDPQQQHMQVADLVDEGKVNIAVLMIGANDFLTRGPEIAAGTLSGAALDSFIAGRISNIEIAVDAVMGSGAVGMVVCGISDVTLTPGGRIALGASPEGRQRVMDAIDATNVGIASMAAERNLPYVDLALLIRDMDEAPAVLVGGVEINVVTPDDRDETHLFQDSIHPQMIGNGIICNLVMTALNEGYGTAFVPFSDLELLTVAGLEGAYAGETYSASVDYGKYVISPFED